MSARGIVIAAPTSGAGKTTVTLGILRALRRRGIDVRAAKSGPDYIDPAFHEAASGASSVNLDAWAMPPAALRGRAHAQGGEVLIVEGAMGVLDGARDGQGSAADLARALGLPVLLVLDIAKSGQSALLPAVGLRALHPDLPLAGVILNRAGTPAHADLARAPLEAAGISVLGALRRDAALHLAERHLGLVQAGETEDLDAFLDRAAERIEATVDLDALLAAATPLAPPDGVFPRLPPLGQRIAIARDPAFAFAYPHLIADWRAQGAEILPFSPLADEGPDARADAVFLPGGYPELFAGRLAAAEVFLGQTRAAALRGARLYGECGGYMAMGEAIVDKDGTRHRMTGLLGLITSFEKRRMHLGYRLAALAQPIPGHAVGTRLRGHEFHYSTILDQPDAPLAQVTDATGATVPETGSTRLQPGGGLSTGTFFHLIASA